MEDEDEADKQLVGDDEQLGTEDDDSDVVTNPLLFFTGEVILLEEEEAEAEADVDGETLG